MTTPETWRDSSTPSSLRSDTTATVVIVVMAVALGLAYVWF